MKKASIFIHTASLCLALSLSFFCAPAFPQSSGAEKPWPNTTVVGAAQGYNPKITDDFYAAVNREWLSSAKIPQGYPRTGSFTERAIQVDKELLSLMTRKDIKGRDAQNVQNLYELFLDWEGRKAGIDELKKIIGRVNEIKTIEEFRAYIASDAFIYACEPFCDFYAGNDMSEPMKSALTIYPTSLSLNDAAEYKALTQNGKNQKAFVDAATLFVLKKTGFGEQEASALLENKYQFEKELASGMMSTEEINSPDYYSKSLNKKSLAELAELSPNFPLVQIMKARGMDKAKRIYLTEPDWLKKINALFVQENLEKAKAYAIASTALAAAAFLDKESYDFHKAASNKRMGIAQAQSHQDDARDFVSGAISVPLSKLYAKHCVDKSAKSRVTKLIKETIAEYKKIVMAQDWLCDATKKKAVQKLSATKIHVAYPALWDNYSALDIRSKDEGENIFSAVKKIEAFYIKKTNKQVNNPFGSGMWNGKVYEVNAFNGFTNNSINIIAGILGGAFFGRDMKDEELYGALGMVIGHEISHSFDATGSQFDKRGAMRNWWTEKDWAAFEERTKKIADYFDSMNTLGDRHQSGKTVQGEAAADIGGVKVMLALSKKKSGFDYDLFFKSYARLWASLCQKEFADIRLNKDTHPFDYLRVNVTLQQFEEFHQFYGIKPGDGMYLAPEKRVGIW